MIHSSIPVFFLSNGDIDWNTLNQYLNDLFEGSDAILPYTMAYNSRFMQLTVDEIHLVNNLVIEYSSERNIRPILGHPLNATLKDLNLFCQTYAGKSCSISVLFPERFYGDIEPIVDFVNAPSEKGLPIILHEMKLISGFDGELIDWPIDLLSELCSLKNVIGIKEDSKNDRITEYLLTNHNNDLDIILAGGGKRRVLSFIPLSLKSWLCGTTLLCPSKVAKVYDGFISGNSDFIDFYIRNIESPFFEIVSKYGWHIAHKAGLQVAGYGERYERNPMSSMRNDAYFHELNKFRCIMEAFSSI